MTIFFLILCILSPSVAIFGDIFKLAGLSASTINCLVSDGTFLYIGTDISIIKYSLVDFVHNETIIGGPYGSAVIYGDSVYFGSTSPPAKLLRLYLNGTYVVNPITTNTTAHTVAFADKGHLYFGTFSSPSFLVKISLSDYSTIDTLQLPELATNLVSATVLNDFVYLGCNATNNTLISYVNLTSFASPDTYTFSPTPSITTGGIIFNQRVYFGTYLGYLESVSTSGVIYSNTVPLMNTSVVVSRGNYAYIVSREGEIFKYNMNTTSPVGSASIKPASDIVSGTVSGEYAYIGALDGSVYQVHIPNDCPDALGGFMYHDDSRAVFSATDVCGPSCAPYTGLITCQDGTLVGNTSFVYSYCRTLNCCNSTFGYLLPNEERIVYKSSCDSTCENGTISCIGGTLIGNTSFTSESCGGKTNQCPCIDVIGGIMLDKETRVLYLTNKSSCSSTCKSSSVTVTCSNGKALYSALGNYTYLNCTECGVDPVSLDNAINATLVLNTGIVRMFFPEAPNVSVTFSEATSANAEYRDPNIDSPGQFLGNTFFITFYKNSNLLHIPPPGTFLEISFNSTEESPSLFYYDNEWTKNCKDPEVTSPGFIRVELCHATQYAIFNLKYSTDEATNITVIVVVIIVLVAVIGVLAGVFVYYRKKTKNISQNVEMKPIYNRIEGVIVGHRLGNGNFGEVYKGEWKGSEVALKMLKNSSEDFIKESEMLSKFSHPNIVQYIGIYVDEKGVQYIVTEFLAKGDLLSLMRRDLVKKEDLNSISRQIAAGMVYLSDQNIVHRDLALRNILVASSEGILVKVSDFGLSRTVTEDNYYTKEGSQLPVKWSAPESLKYGKFSSKSDVWSFGVCLWELFSKGETPYFTMSNAETMEKVINEGFRLPQPENSSLEMYKLMLWCWKADPEERPSFMEILAEIDKTITPKIEIVAVIENSKEENVYNN